MASEVFNPNPTIIATAGPTARKRVAQARHSLWLSDDEDATTTYDSDDESEPIDADEVFGNDPFLCPLCTGPKAEPQLSIDRFDTLNQRSRASIDDVGTTGRRFCSTSHRRSQSRSCRVHSDRTTLWHVDPYRALYSCSPASRAPDPL